MSNSLSSELAVERKGKEDDMGGGFSELRPRKRWRLLWKPEALLSQLEGD